MRFLLLATGIAVGIAAGAAALGGVAHAQNYPWCAEYGGRGMGGVQNCGFSTYRQCMEDVSGIGGFCMRNTTYRSGGYRHYRDWR